MFKEVAWDQEASIKLLTEKYTDWNPVVKALTDVTPDIRFYPNLSCSESLPTWVFGDRAVLIGDAAHAHGGAYATGGSLAIDDAYAIYLFLLSVFPVTATCKPSGAEIRKALELYEATRKPHADRLLKMAHTASEAKTEQIRTGKLETDMELRARARKGSNTNWLHEHDVVKAFEETLRRSSHDAAESSPDISARL
jgi:salicylate hydroxylase